MLVRLLYASRSQGPIADDTVSKILAQSRKNNPEFGVTGVLCICQGDVFMQVLEGGRKEVNQLYERVVKDERHTDVTLLHYSEIDERRFSGWRMGRVELNKVNAALVLKYSEKPIIDPFSLSGRVAITFLEELANTASIVGGT